MNFRPEMKSCLQPMQIFLKYLDLIQDILLADFIIKAIGGISMVLQNPTIFSSTVSFVPPSALSLTLNFLKS